MIKKHFKDKANAILEYISIGLLWIRNLIQKRFGLVSYYQSNPFCINANLDSNVRVCEERYLAFSSYFSKNELLSVIDIGCNQGYFLFRMAPYTSIGLGIEKARNEVMYARSLAGIKKIGNIAFLTYNVKPDNITSIPSADVIIFLSVFHHWVRDFGEESAKQMLRELGQKCRKYFVFETGQYEEKGKKWTDGLSFMGKDSHQWITKFLTSCHFGEIKMLGEFRTTVTDVPRKLYLAIRLPSSSCEAASKCRLG